MGDGGRPVCRKSCGNIAGFKSGNSGTVAEAELYQILQLSKFPDFFKITFIDKKPLGGNHGSVHLRIPQETSYRKGNVMNGYAVANTCQSLLHVVNGNIDLSFGRINYIAIQIQQKIKTFALHRKAVILHGTCEGVFTNDNLCALNVEKGKHLKIFYILFRTCKSRKPFHINIAGVHLHKMRRLSS